MQEYFVPDWWDEWQKENYRKKLLLWNLKRNRVVAKILVVKK